MLDRPDTGAMAVLASLDFGEPDYEESLQELNQLASSAGLQVQATVQGRRAKPDAKLFFGSGKAEELSATMQATRCRWMWRQRCLVRPGRSPRVCSTSPRR